MTKVNDHSSESDSSLSAMFDGEANEQDIALLLQQNGDDIQRQLKNYHLIRNSLQQSLSDEHVEDSLIRNIWAEIEREDNKGHADTADNVVLLNATQNAQTKASWKMMFSGMAVAASVAFLVIFSGDVLLTSNSSESDFTASIESLDAVDGIEEVSVAELDTSKSVIPSDSLRLQHYLRQHVEQSAFAVGQGMIPMAKVVSYPVEE